MKEFRVLKGHKKEVCCKSSTSYRGCAISERPNPSPSALAWHPIHPILVSGGSEGAILHWDLAAPEPTFSQPAAQPRATLSQAHDSNVWSLTFHPLGHLLVSASNDHTTRFWSRERPGDVSSVFSGGGEKPPEVLDTGGQDEDEDAMVVPGFTYAAAGASGTGMDWWAKDDDGAAAASSSGRFAGGAGVGENRFGRRGDAGGLGSDDFVPGFGPVTGPMAASSESAVAGRQSGPLPPQEDMFGTGAEDWNRGGGPFVGGGRGSRWGPRRGGRGQHAS
jgi:polyadenylation factor subunit 2